MAFFGNLVYSFIIVIICMTNFNYSLVNAFSIFCVVQPVIHVSIHFYCFPLVLAPVSLSVIYSLLKLIFDHSLGGYSGLMSWKLQM